MKQFTAHLGIIAEAKKGCYGGVKQLIERTSLMSSSRCVRTKVLGICFLFLPSFACAQVAVSGAEWTSVDTFTFCKADDCETFRHVKLSVNSIEVGQDISVINLDTGTTIADFQVKSIKYGRQVKMCWLGDKEGFSKTYITVGGCNR